MKGFFVLLLACLACGCGSLPERRFEAQRGFMGTRFRLVYYCADAELAGRAEELCWERLDQLDRRLSDYKPESELSLLSKTWGQWIPCSGDLWRVLVSSEDMGRSSEGAFDITVGPLVRLWKRAMRQERLPAPEALQDARARVGPSLIELDTQGQRARLARSGMRLDLGGIAKGDALDELLVLLQGLGIERALVEGGGDIAVAQAPPGSKGWRIRLGGSHGAGCDLLLEHQAVASSGSRFQFLEVDGVRYSHIVNPTTGLGVVDPHVVSVVARRAHLADAAATALSVLGPAAGLAWIERRPELEACLWNTQIADAEPLRSSGFCWTMLAARAEPSSPDRSVRPPRPAGEAETP